MFFSSRNRKTDDIDIKINDVTIERVHVTKFLGVQIDSKLTWKNHVDYISKKLSKSAAILSKARKVLHKTVLINLYYTFSYPYLLYCNIIWGNTYRITNNKLMLIQKRLIRIITSSPYRAHTGPLFFANKLLNVYDINNYTIGIFIYRCMHESLPDLFDNFFMTNRDFHGRELRDADDLYTPYARLDIRRFTIRIHGAKLWNNLPAQIRNSDSIHIFKRRLRSHIIESKLET